MIDLLRKRMQQVAAANAVQEEQALKEMLPPARSFVFRCKQSA